MADSPRRRTRTSRTRATTSRPSTSRAADPAETEIRRLQREQAAADARLGRALTTALGWCGIFALWCLSSLVTLLAVTNYQLTFRGALIADAIIGLIGLLAVLRFTRRR